MHIKMYFKLILNTCLIADFRQVCYNLTNYVVKDMGRLGNHKWIELIYGKDCSYFSPFVQKFYSRKFQVKFKKYIWNEENLYVFSFFLFPKTFITIINSRSCFWLNIHKSSVLFLYNCMCHLRATTIQLSEYKYLGLRL